MIDDFNLSVSVIYLVLKYITQPMPTIDPIFIQCWPTVYDAGPT